MYSRNIQDKNSKNKKLKIISLLAVILLLIFALLIWAEKSGTIDLLGNNPQKNSATDNNSEDESFINLEPPTEEEQSAGDEVDIKKNTNDPTTENTTSSGDTQNPGSTTAVTVVISDTGVYDGMVEVSAFTPDAIANGTCTYEFSSGAKTVTKSNQARADASSSICIDNPFPVSELAGGDVWKVKVTYKSNSGTYEGTRESTLTL